jgi:hypothetical protein
VPLLLLPLGAQQYLQLHAHSLQRQQQPQQQGHYQYKQHQWQAPQQGQERPVLGRLLSAS